MGNSVMRSRIWWTLRAVVASLGLLLASGAVAQGTGPAPSAGTPLVIVLNSGDGSVSLIDRATFKVVGSVPVGREPHHLMPTLDRERLIVANAASNDLVMLNPRSGAVLERVPKISDPYQIGYSPDGKWFVSVSLRLDRVDIYHAADLKLAKRIATGKMPSHVAFDAESKFAFVTLQEANQVVAIDLQRHAVSDTISVGNAPAGVWMTPDDRHLLVGITGEDHVAVIDWRARKVVRKIPTGKGAHNFLPRGDGRHVFLTNRVANTISIIDMQDLRVVRTLDVPGGPDCMELTADGKELWVTARFAKRVAVVDVETGKVKQTIPVGRSPHGIYFHDHAPRR